MSFAVWSEKPPFTEAELTAGEKIYQVGALWVVTDGPAPSPASIAALQAPEPDIGNFRGDLLVALGGLLAANLLARAYPLFDVAMTHRNYPAMQALVLDAHATGVLTDKQYAALQALAVQYRIPITLA